MVLIFVCTKLMVRSCYCLIIWFIMGDEVSLTCSSCWVWCTKPVHGRNTGEYSHPLVANPGAHQSSHGAHTLPNLPLRLPYCSLLQWTLRTAVTWRLHRNPSRSACVQLSAAAPHTHQHLSSHIIYAALWRISPLSTLTWQLEVVMATCLLTFA